MKKEISKELEKTISLNSKNEMELIDIEIAYCIGFSNGKLAGLDAAQKIYDKVNKNFDDIEQEEDCDCCEPDCPICQAKKEQMDQEYEDMMDLQASQI